MQLQDILFSQGFGARRTCLGLVQQGLVQVQGETVTDAFADFAPEGLRARIEVPLTESLGHVPSAARARASGAPDAAERRRAVS